MAICSHRKHFCSPSSLVMSLTQFREICKATLSFQARTTSGNSTLRDLTMSG